MSTQQRNQRSEIFNIAWQFVKRNGYRLSEALKTAWLNIKLKANLKKGIVKFYFTKVDGTLRETFGTLKQTMLPATQGTGRKANETLQTYFDTEKQEYRCYKKANFNELLYYG